MSKDLQPIGDRRVARIERVHRAALLDLGLCALVAYMLATGQGHPIVWAVLLALQIAHVVLVALGKGRLLDPRHWRARP